MGTGEVVLHHDSTTSIESTWVVTSTRGKGKVIVPKSPEGEEQVGGGTATIAALSNMYVRNGCSFMFLYRYYMTINGCTDAEMYNMGRKWNTRVLGWIGPCRIVGYSIMRWILLNRRMRRWDVCGIKFQC